MRPTQLQLSLVTPCKNQVDFLSENVELLHALAPQAQHVVFDGASTDGSAAYLAAMKERIEHLSFSSESDSGMYDALRRGFKACTGDLLGYINCDDFIFPWTVDVVLDYFENDPNLDFIVGDCFEVYDEKWAAVINPSIRHALRFLRGGGFLSQPSIFFRKSFYERLGGVNEDLHLVGDSDLWLQFLRSGGKGLRVREVLCGMRQVEGRLTDTFSDRIQAEMAVVLQRHDQMRLRRDVVFQELSARLLHRHFVFEALRFLRTGQARYWQRFLNSGIVDLDKAELERSLFHSTQNSHYACISSLGKTVFPFFGKT